MLKRMILAGLLAAMAAPALASDASYDNKAAATQASPSAAAAKTDSAPTPASACACQKHRA